MRSISPSTETKIKHLKVNKMRLKSIGVICALLFNALVGGFIAGFFGVSSWIGSVVAVCISILLGKFLPEGAALEGVFVEVWTGEMIKKFRHADMATFMEGIPDYSDKAKYDVIHLVDIGGDPDVLVNNTTYPLEIQELADGDIAISLKKFTTKPTRVTEDELHAISYDKMGSVIERHGNAIKEKEFDMSIHAMAPKSNSSATPVLFTTGETDGVTHRKRITRADIIALKKNFDNAGIPVKGRRLVLCPDHIEDLLLTDQKFADQYYNYTTGKISNLYSFEVYEYVNNPIYTVAGVKKNFGVAATTGEFQASVAFFTQRIFKASGTIKMFSQEAANDPVNHQNLIDFDHYYLCMPVKEEAIGAIVSQYTIINSIDATTPAEFSKNGGTKHSLVTATGEFTVVNDDPTDVWFTVEKTGNQVCVVCTANSEVDAPARTGSFTVTLTADNTKTKTITVSQAANA